MPGEPEGGPGGRPLQGGYVVVGGGIAGLFLAYLLASEGARVALVAPQGRPSASGAAAGIVTTLMPPHLAELALRSASLIESVSPESIEYMKAYWVPSEGCGEVERFNESRGILSRGEAPGWMRGASRVLRGRLPVVDTGVLLTRLYSRVHGLGVRLVDSEAVAVGEDRVETGEEVIEGRPVVAAGPWSARLVPQLEALTTIYRCQVLSVRSPPRELRRTVIIDDDIDFYMVCWDSECLVGDGSNDEIAAIEDGFSPDLDDLLDVAYRASERVPWLLESRAASYWAAPCIAALDSSPLLGPPRGSPVAVLTGFNGAGVTLAPASAEIMARWLLGRAPLPGFLRADRRVERVGVWPPEPFRLC